MNNTFMGQPIRFGDVITPPTHVRLWDVLTKDQQHNIEQWLPGEHQFRLENLKGDAQGWVTDMENAGRITTAAKPDSVAELGMLMKARIVRALDGKMAMVSADSAEPIEGRYAVGTLSKQEFAEKMIAEAKVFRDPPAEWQIAEKVDPRFADYLEAVGESVAREGNSAVWIVATRADQDRVIREAWLVSNGANNLSTDANASPIHKAAERMYPREKRVWDKGLASTWLVTDAVRYKMANAVQTITGGSFSMREIGGHLVQAMRECQSAMEQMVESKPEQTLVPVRIHMENIWTELEQALSSLKKQPSPEPKVVAELTGTFDAVNYTLQELEKREALRTQKKMEASAMPATPKVASIPSTPSLGG